MKRHLANILVYDRVMLRNTSDLIKASMDFLQKVMV